MQSDYLINCLNKVNINGIIQVGANLGQELDIIRKYTTNIICFEPVPNIFEILSKNNTDIICYNYGLGDFNEIKSMYISSNNSESSSFLKPLNHNNYYNNVHFTNNIDLEIKRFDSLNIELDKYNVLISDTQGYETKVLKGFGKLLDKFDLIFVEYINSELYENYSNLEELSKYLYKFNFVIDSFMEVGAGWGNACYLKSNKI